LCTIFHETNYPEDFGEDAAQQNLSEDFAANLRKISMQNLPKDFAVLHNLP
jgi:hypothetical protein